MTDSWKDALEAALGPTVESLEQLIPASEGVLRDWLTRATRNEADPPTPTIYLALSDLTGIEVEVLSGEVEPSHTLAVALRSRGQVASASVLHRSVSLLRAARAVLRLSPYVELRARLKGVQDKFPNVVAPGIAKKAGSRAALMLRGDFGCGSEPILDLPELVERLGVPVELSVDLPDGIHGITTWSQAREGWTAAISINARDYWTVQRYSLAHELCHVIFQDRPVNLVSEVDASSAISKDPTESRAEAFATNFLAPRVGLSNYWKSHELSSLPRMTALAMVMWHWGLSREAASYALQDSGQIPWTEEDTRAAKSTNVQHLFRDAGLLEEWSSMRGTEGTFSPSIWLAESTAELFTQGRLPIESYAIVTRSDPDEALTVLLGH